MVNKTNCEYMAGAYPSDQTQNILKHLVICTVFVVGAIGNIAALWILYKSAKTRNKKHVLMLRCLATNDLVAQLGMLLVITLQKFSVVERYWICVGFVLLRAFGIGSGCVAFVMALERWLALTRPFLYHQLVTYRILKRFIFSMWCGGALLTYLPLFGFGLFFKDKCCRYRYATEFSDQVYAYMFLVFGTCLCIGISACNLTVMCELSRIRSHNRVLVRRVSRSIINNRVTGCAPRYQTPEEVAFAKLMAVICIIFVACWAPQMISIPMAQFCTQAQFCKAFYKVADMLMCVYFTLDPYVYVLQRYMENGILPCCFSRRSMSSIPTTTTTGTPTSVLLHPPSFAVPAVM